jgi:hypothetical protein
MIKDKGSLSDSPRQIVLAYLGAHDAPRVWIMAHATDDLPEGTLPVSDGLSVYDAEGYRIVSIPADWCSFYTDEEAASISACIDADDRLLSYARG